MSHFNQIPKESCSNYLFWIHFFFLIKKMKEILKDILIFTLVLFLGSDIFLPNFWLKIERYSQV